MKKTGMTEDILFKPKRNQGAVKMKVANIGDCFERIKNGYSIANAKDKGGVPISRIETISNGEIDFNKVGYADIFDVDGLEEYIIKKNDILMSHINSESHLGKTAIFENSEQQLIHGMNLLLLRTNEKIISRYAYYFFNSKRFKSDLSRIIKKAVNQASFSTSNFKKLQIPLPPLPIQRKIAEVLDKADAIRKRSRQILAKYDQLAQSVFLEMFGDPVRNEKGWEIVAIRDMVSEVKYGTSSKAEEKGELPYLRMNNITYSGYMDYSNLKFITVPEKDREKYTVRKGDVLFNRTNSKELVGKTGLITDDLERVIAGYLIRIRTNELANPYYLWAHLNSRWAKLTLESMCKSIVGMANINAQELQNIKILKAPIELQHQFASIIAQIEKQKTQTQLELDRAEELYQSLLQRAFTGELFPEKVLTEA